jgi:hypothetical protein
VAKQKPGNAERRAMVEQMRAEQERRERLRSLGILGACLLVVLAILGLAIGKYLADGSDGSSKIKLPGIGVPASAAGCDPVTTKKPTGKQRSGVEGNHVEIGTKITYPTSPPAFGQHWPNFLQTSEYRNFYSPSDRPELERMVHSLEHGHTLIWYDETIKPGSTEYQQLQEVADRYNGTTTYINVVPWLSADGPAFPEGKHVVLTHWAGSGDHQEGIWQYCGKTSGAVIQDFVKKYPNTDSPEAGAP